jgi:putative phosphoesterase
MRVAALYDVHGNLPALEAILRELEREPVDRILFGGDIAAGPFPVETMDAIAGLGAGALLIRGNADRELAAADTDSDDVWWRRARWVAAQLGAGRVRDLAGLPETVTLELPCGRMLFCHGSPRSDEEILTAATTEDRLAPILAGVDADIVVCGHTHVQFDRRAGTVRLVNAGSVGMPYEDARGAYWALFADSVELRRTEYDVAGAAERIRATAYPDPDAFVAMVYEEPPTPAEATEHFERVATGG